MVMKQVGVDQYFSIRIELPLLLLTTSRINALLVADIVNARIADPVKALMVLNRRFAALRVLDIRAEFAA